MVFFLTHVGQVSMRSWNLNYCNIFLFLFQFERNAAKENEITGVSSTAVAKYLERKRKEKEKIEGKYFNIVHIDLQVVDFL